MALLPRPSLTLRSELRWNGEDTLLWCGWCAACVCVCACVVLCAWHWAWSFVDSLDGFS